MIIIITLGIYLGIGVILGIIVNKIGETDVNDYKSKIEELNKWRAEAETFEAKCVYRDAILEVDKKYDFALLIIDAEKYINRKFLYSVMLIIMAIGWLPVIVKVTLNSKGASKQWN